MIKILNYIGKVMAICIMVYISDDRYSRIIGKKIKCSQSMGWACYIYM